MKKYLLSIPRSLTGTFFELTGKPAAEWMVDCDPGDARVGSGGGGYLFILAKDPEAASRIRGTLQNDPPNARARFIDLSLSQHGFQVTRS